MNNKLNLAVFAIFITFLAACGGFINERSVKAELESKLTDPTIEEKKIRDNVFNI